jgi:outer membrane lipoprotein-sorting protein
MLERVVELIRFPWPVAGLLCLLLASTAGASSADLERMLKTTDATLAGYQDCTFTFSLQNRIGGKLLPKETIEVQCARGGACYLKWTGTAHQGREVIYKPGWNNNKTWVKDGGLLSFTAVALDPNDPMIKRDYVRPVTFLAPENLVKAIKEIAAAGMAVTAGASRTFTVENADDSRVTVAFYANGLPQSIQAVSAQGQAMEQYEVSNLRLNAGLPANTFDPLNPAYGFPGYSSDGIFIHPDKMKAALERSWAAVKDYTCLLNKRERIRGEMQPRHTLALKFRKPGDIYAKWQKGPHEGRELLYRLGKDEKLLARESGVLGLTSVRLALDSSLVRRDTNHPLTDLDIGVALKTIYANLTPALPRNEVRLKFGGLQNIGGRYAYAVESWFQNVKARGYYAAHAYMCHDLQTGLPIKIVNWDERDQMFEEFEWTRLQFNVGLTDRDFDPANPDYRL